MVAVLSDVSSSRRSAAARSLDRTDALVALTFVVGIYAIGAAPALVTGPDSAWFRALEKPTLSSPGWAFGIVWPVLFSLLGIAL